MPSEKIQSSSIKNKIKRQEVVRKAKKVKGQLKLKKRLDRAKLEAQDSAAKKERLEANVPRTLDNTREFDPSVITADPSATSSAEAGPSCPPNEIRQDEVMADIASDPFATYFSLDDPSLSPKVLITTSPKASRATYDFCEELVGVFPGSQFINRQKGKGFEIGRIASWAAKRSYKHMCVVNEDMKKPNAITFIHLPNGPTAYFKLTSVELTKQIFGHARATPHSPELVLNNFVTRLGHTVGRLFQSMFPPMPEFQGRQVVTLHNQRDFLFFRRHRYAFRSPEKVALQEIGPRFTLKLQYLKRDLPIVQKFGRPSRPLMFDTPASDVQHNESQGPIKDPSIETQDEYIWIWKPELETSRKTFFL